MKVMFVSSSNGSLEVNRETGEVIECFLSDGGEGIDQIAKFDLDEWKKRYETELPDSIDILDLGYWQKDGKYESPEKSWRLEHRTMVRFQRWNCRVVLSKFHASESSPRVDLIENKTGAIVAHLNRNFPGELSGNEIAIDVNNCGFEAERCLKEIKAIMGDPIRFINSGFCTYPVYSLNI